jgi:conjugal transfer pilus assembly protein TraV
MIDLVARSPLPPLAIAAALLSGCASNLTGLDGSSQYACRTPVGVKCDSVSGTYHNAIRNNLPTQHRPARPTGEPGNATPDTTPSPQAPQTAPTALAVSTDTPSTAAKPLRAAPRILRLWIKPWEDADHDLNGESLVYVQVDNGRWLVDHAQHLAREPFAPVRAARAPGGASGEGTSADPKTRALAAQPTADHAAPVSDVLRDLRTRSAPASND